jgi:hypothetical protein
LDFGRKIGRDLSDNCNSKQRRVTFLIRCRQGVSVEFTSISDGKCCRIHDVLEPIED